MPNWCEGMLKIRGKQEDVFNLLADNLLCKDCDFGYSDCNEKILKWANSEYVEPSVDWSKVAVDTPILVRDSEEGTWKKRYFAKYENGIVYAWECGATSWSAHRNYVTDWKMAKLAESEE